jgi:hypothetical protein
MEPILLLATSWNAVTLGILIGLAVVLGMAVLRRRQSAPKPR